MNPKYELIIYWSRRTTRSSPRSPSSLAAWLTAPPYAEALAAAEVVIREWIETAKALGRPISEARGRLAYA